MKKAVFGVLMAAALAASTMSGAVALASQQPAANTASAMMSVESQQALVSRYCAGCHNDRTKSGGFSLTSVDLANAAANAEQVEKIILKLRTGMMPPSGRPRPELATINSFAATLEDEIDKATSANPNPGKPFLHRLNRTEYKNAIHDMLGINIDAELLLPPDDMSHGFDNMSEVLSISPSLMDGYIRAAGKIGRIAIGDAKMKPVVETYPVSQNFSQNRYVEGTPFGTRGGMSVVHNFPADGEYGFIVSFVFTTSTSQIFGITAKNEQVEVAVNGESVAVMDIKQEMKIDEVLKTPLIKVKAGPQRISVSFVKNVGSRMDLSKTCSGRSAGRWAISPLDRSSG
jgi:hypothetical protein